jgi:hypothetical protein
VEVKAHDANRKKTGGKLHNLGCSFRAFSEKGRFANNPTLSDRFTVVKFLHLKNRSAGSKCSLPSTLFLL